MGEGRTSRQGSRHRCNLVPNTDFDLVRQTTERQVMDQFEMSLPPGKTRWLEELERLGKSHQVATSVFLEETEDLDQ